MRTASLLRAVIDPMLFMLDLKKVTVFDEFLIKMNVPVMGLLRPPMLLGA